MGHVESMNMTASAEQHPAQWQSSQQHEEIGIAYLSRWRNETIYLLVHGEASNTKLHFALFAATLLNGSKTSVKDWNQFSQMNSVLMSI